MLEQLSIQGFRCFSSFQIAGLRRLNLVSGRNSTGKSSLLEAIQFFLQPGLESLTDILDWRDQLPDAEQSASWDVEAIRPLFFQTGDQPRLDLHIFDASRSLRARVAHHVRNEKGQWLETPDPSVGLGKWVLRFELNQESPTFFLPLDGSEEIGNASRRLSAASQAFLRFADRSQPPVAHARANSFTSDALSEMIEFLLGTEGIEDVYSVIRWVIPDAKHIFTKGLGASRSIYIQSPRFATPQPLAAFGDGATRLVGLCLSAILAKGGYCLIDEIENGIHFSLFRELWPLLNRLSRELDVQIFATTHSKDCLDAFEEATAQPDFDAAYYRLERDSSTNQIEAVRLDYQSFFSRVSGTFSEVR